MWIVRIVCIMMLLYVASSICMGVKLGLCHTLREEYRLRVFERDEVTGEWRILHYEELNDLYCSSNIVWVIESRRMRWAGHVARMEERCMHGRIILRWIFRKWDGGHGLD